MILAKVFLLRAVFETRKTGESVNISSATTVHEIFDQISARSSIADVSAYHSFIDSVITQAQRDIPS